MPNYQNGQKEGRITTCDEKEKRKDKTGKKRKIGQCWKISVI
jgi:hypothetical protein